MISTHILLSSLLLISSLVNGIIAIPTRRAPPASLPITRHARATGSSKLADADRARANILKSLAFGKLAGQTRDVPVPVTNHGVCAGIHPFSGLVLIFVLACSRSILRTLALVLGLVSKFCEFLKSTVTELSCAKTR
jgi:hypothetical protein